MHVWSLLVDQRQYKMATYVHVYGTLVLISLSLELSSFKIRESHRLLQWTLLHILICMFYLEKSKFLPCQWPCPSVCLSSALCRIPVPLSVQLQKRNTRRRSPGVGKLSLVRPQKWLITANSVFNCLGLFCIPAKNRCLGHIP